MITIQTSILKSVLDKFSRIIPSRATMPILTCVKLECDPDGIVFSGTDLEVGLSIKLPADVGDGVYMAVPFAVFRDVVSAASGADVELYGAANSTLVVKSGPMQTKIRCLDAGEFPPMAAPVEGGKVILTAPLLAGLRRVLPAASTDEARPILRGVFDGAATDGFRVHHDPAAALPGGIIPARALGEMVKIFSADAEIKCETSTGRVIFTAGGKTLSVTTIEGRYPDWRAIVPNAQPTATVQIDRLSFLSAIKQAEIIARENNNIVRLTVGDGKVVVNASSDETGDMTTELAAETTGSLMVGMNCRLIRDAVEACEGKINMAMIAANAPVRVTGSGEFIAVVMPMHIEK